MQLSKLSYYSDFVVYPLVLMALTASGRYLCQASQVTRSNCVPLNSDGVATIR